MGELEDRVLEEELTWSLPTHRSSWVSSNAIVDAGVGSKCGPAGGTTMRVISSQAASIDPTTFQDLNVV
jgi:hypothetical protein